MADSGKQVHGIMADPGPGPFSSPHPDRFDEWLRAPAPLESTHPLFDIRRALPAEFDRIYDLVDDTFGVKRPRAVYEWLYRKNPYGAARCWLVIERLSGRLLGSSALWPWPLARGAAKLEGTLGGDSVIASGFQRQGLAALRGDVAQSHAWRKTKITFSWPNDKSQRRASKRGRALLGPVPLAILLIDTKAYLAERGWPPIVSTAGGMVADSALKLWRGINLRSDRGMRIEAIRHFDGAFDEVTQRHMAWPEFWLPHTADFLNWRYLDHPTGQYAAFALLAGDALAGYAVLRLAGHAAWLMEFVTSNDGARTLLRHVVRTARAAGSTHVRFSAPIAWRHWGLLRAAGFVSIPSKDFLWISAVDDPEPKQFDRWQWVPGDMDVL